MRKNITFNLGLKKIGTNQPCFIIAEIGSNHNNSIKIAKKSIFEAAKSGADAVKFQTFKAENHYSKFTPGFKYLNKTNTFNLIKKLELNREWQIELKLYAEKLGLIFFSSPCDVEAVDELNKLGVKLHKVASFDITDQFLIKKIASSKKPIIISTGLANHEDITHAINSCKKEKNNKIILLQCTSLYPAPSRLSNLNSIISMKDRYGYVTGYSDHTIGDHNAIAAVALGAKVLEKHFTVDNKMKGPDHKFAIEPFEFSLMVKKIREIEMAMGDGVKRGPSTEEMEMFIKGRRSMHINKNLPKGSILKKEDIIIKRPGLGIIPSKINELIGKKLKKKIKADQWLTWDMI
jgi:sialic acid synthase SpsE